MVLKNAIYGGPEKPSFSWSLKMTIFGVLKNRCFFRTTIFDSDRQNRQKCDILQFPSFCDFRHFCDFRQKWQYGEFCDFQIIIIFLKNALFFKYMFFPIIWFLTANAKIVKNCNISILVYILIFMKFDVF